MFEDRRLSRLETLECQGEALHARLKWQLYSDIGNTWEPRLFSFLKEQLQNFKIVFYLLVSHGAYGTKISTAQEAVRSFAVEMEEVRSQLGSTIGRFGYLNQTRFDLTDTVTVLGCTRFSNISNEQRKSVSIFCADFSEIEDWTIDAHSAAHQSDLNWLNEQVKLVEHPEPNRKIAIFTHHSPTPLEAANDSRHAEDVNGVKSAFVTNLSDQACGTSEIMLRSGRLGTRISIATPRKLELGRGL